MDQRFYSAQEIADMLGLHLRTVQLLLRTGKLGGLKLGKKWKATQEDIDAYVAQQREAARRPKESL
jgi:excisionase family DNA binding protein